MRQIKLLIISLLVGLSVLLCACGDEIAEPPVIEVVPAEETPVPVASPDITYTSLCVSEVMASNHTVLLDGYGVFSDWAELWNNSSAPEDISGFWLSDDADDLCKWRFPQLVLEADERIVVFFSGNDSIGDELHCSFRLPKEGGTLYISSPAGFLLREFTYCELSADQVYACIDDVFTVSYDATPGLVNNDESRLAFLESGYPHGALMINEAVLYNDTFAHGGDCYDWIELVNSSSEIIELSDYYLTDSLDEPFQSRLPAKKLEPGSRFMAYCGENRLNSSDFHVDFSLSSLGDELYIFSSDGSLCDRMGMNDIPLDCSKGRMDGEEGFFFFTKCTPDGDNKKGVRMVSGDVSCETEQGIYENVTDISVVLSGGSTVYYTLDGSVPTARSNVYTSPILLTKTAVVRALCIEDGKLPGKCSTYSYIINEGHSLPVMSIACKQGDFNLLYYNAPYNKILSDCTLFDGDNGFQSGCQITLHGTSARTAWKKKNFKIIFKNRFGGDVEYGGFENTDCTEFHSLLLRGGNSVGMQIYRDSLSALAAYRTFDEDPLTLDSKHCVVYVNGKYFGIFALREAYSDKYAADHTSSPEGEAIICRAPITSAQSKELFELHKFISTKPMSDPDNYAMAAEKLDMGSLARWMCIEGFLNNLDPTGNIRYIKGSDPDSKWQLALFDFDISMTNGVASLTTVLDRGSQIGRMTSSLRSSPEFCTLLLETASKLYKNGLTSETLVKIFDEMSENLSGDIERDLKQWGESMKLYENSLKSMRAYLVGEREESWVKLLQVYTRADDDVMAQYFPDFFNK